MKHYSRIRAEFKAESEQITAFGKLYSVKMRYETLKKANRPVVPAG